MSEREERDGGTRVERGERKGGEERERRREREAERKSNMEACYHMFITKTYSSTM